MIVYMITYSGARTNIMADFQLLDKEGLIEFLKKGAFGKIRYGKIGSYVKLLREMTLEEFELEFDGTLFDLETITEHFRKDISLVYGRHKQEKEMKAIPSKKLQKFHAYEDVHGSKYIYLGKAERTEIIGTREPVVQSGNGFISVWSKFEPTDQQMTYAHILKTSKKLVKDLGKVEHEFKDFYEVEYNRPYGGGHHRVTLKLLEWN